jgi:hypothetical protein
MKCCFGNTFLLRWVEYNTTFALTSKLFVFYLLLFGIDEHWAVRAVKYGTGRLQNTCTPSLANFHTLVLCYSYTRAFPYKKNLQCNLTYSTEVIRSPIYHASTVCYSFVFCLHLHGRTPIVVPFSLKKIVIYFVGN